MADGVDPSAGAALPFTDMTGGIGMNPLLVGMGMGAGGQIMDPAWQGALQRQRYAMSLLSGASDASPTRSWVGALARGVQGVMGGLQERWAERSMADVAQRMMGQNQAAQDQVNQTLQGLVGGVAQGQPSQIGQPGQPPPAVSQAQPGDGDTIGARNRNPLNLRSAQGAPQSQGFAVFPTTAAGVRATASQLQSYQDNQGINTIRGLATRWVSDPKADMTSYVGDISKAVGVGPDDPINTHDPVFMAKYIQAAVPHESVGKSGNWVSPQDIQDGLNGVNLFGPTTTTSGGAGGTGGPAPGSGFAAMIRIQQIAAQLMSNPFNPAGQAYGRSLMSMAPQLARIGAAGSPQPVPGQPGLFYQTDPVSGQMHVSGQAQDQSVADMRLLTQLGQTPWANMTPQQQQDYTGAYSRIGKPSLQYNDKTGWQTIPSTALPANITVPPNQMPGALPGRAPGAAAPPGQPGTIPGGTLPMTPPITTTGPGAGQPPPSPAQIDAGNRQIDLDQTTAAGLRGEALEAQPLRMITDQIRALMQSGTVKTGALTPLAQEISRIGAGLGFDPKLMQDVTNIDPATGDLLNKIFTQYSTMASRTLGAHEAGSVVQTFINNYPSLATRPDAINEFTRVLDLQNRFTQDRARLAQNWMDAHRGDPANYQSINSDAFNNWAKSQGLDPSVYTAAALMASHQTPQIYTSALARGPEGDRQLDAAGHLAWSVYPGVKIQAIDRRTGKLADFTQPGTSQ